MTKKEFILANIAPYYHNPEICGYDKEKNSCQYLTNEGKMCVAGKNMLYPESFSNDINIKDIIADGGQLVLKEESRNILTSEDWSNLQYLHDMIAERKFPSESGNAVMRSLGITEAEIKKTI